MARLGFAGTGLIVALLASGAPVLADGEDDEERARPEWQESGDEPDAEEADEPRGGEGGARKNPLERILDLMGHVEDRLFEADTGEFTQREQRRIVEAMRFEGETRERLDELIHEIEKKSGQ